MVKKTSEDKHIPKFIVDEMCGRVAKWLRLLGFDTYYTINREKEKYTSNDFDMSLLSIAAIENRILITRDSQLYTYARNVGIKAIYLPEKNIKDKLRKIFSEANICKIKIHPRCTICNSKTICVEKKLVIEKIPPKVAKNFNEFMICPTCKKVYWFGSHWRYIIKVLEDIGIKISFRKCV